jgi:molybdopterin-guanine dinucleotide biosynthesis protein A
MHPEGFKFAPRGRCRSFTFFADGRIVILYKGGASEKEGSLMTVDLDKDSPAPFRNVTGVILLGGRSSRYGSNKALVEIGGVRLIDRVAGVMKSIFHELLLVTNTPGDYAYLDVPMVEDLIKGLGPMGGIYTGLTTLPDEAGFFVACDMPFLNEHLIRHMIHVRDDFDAVLPRMDWMLEPLHALYSKKCLPVLQNAIEQHQYQIAKCFAGLRVRYVDEEELRLWDPDLRSFFNINKPQDLPEAASKPDAHAGH